MADDGASAADRARRSWGLPGDPPEPEILRSQSCSHSEHEKDGCCNTRSADTNCPQNDIPPRLGGSRGGEEEEGAPEARIGLDTVSWGWSDGEAVERFLRLDGVILPGDDPRPLRVVSAPGASVRLTRRLDGLGTVGAYPGAGLFYVEGRAGALHVGDERDHGLGRPRDLADTERRVLDGLGGLLGRAPRAPGGLRRVDLAGELRFDRGEHGVELLTLLHGVHVARLRVAPVHEVGGPGIETVYWRTPKRNIPAFRAYDKGIESGTADRGERIRLERQIRHVKAQRRTTAQWLGQDLGELYARPLRAWLGDGVAAGTAGQLMELLTDAAVLWPTYWGSGVSWATRSGTVQAGSVATRRPRAGHVASMWPARKVERVLGTLAIAHDGGAAWPAWSPKQRQRRMAEVRQLGLLLTDHPVVVDVDRAVSSLCDLWRAAA